MSTVATHVLDTSPGRPAAGTFPVEEAGGHDHVPLVLGAFAYSTYRGS